MERVIAVPGARLRVRIAGSGPALLLLGGTADGGALGVLRELLEPDFTVVTYDRRGLGGSSVDDAAAPVEVGDDADDAAAVIAALGGPVLVAGTSNGAVQGLELAIRHPGRVRLLLAHEPPLPALLPAAERAAVVAAQGRIDGLVTSGAAAATAGLLAELTGAGRPGREPGPLRPVPAPRSSSPAEQARAAFLARIALPLHRYCPDPAALARCSVPIVVAAGTDGAELVGARSATALAELRGAPVVHFPGGHSGFLDEPAAFAAQQREVLGRPPRPASSIV